MSLENQEREDIALIIKIGKQLRAAVNAFGPDFEANLPSDTAVRIAEMIEAAIQDLRVLQKREEKELQHALAPVPEGHHV